MATTNQWIGAFKWLVVLVIAVLAFLLVRGGCNKSHECPPITVVTKDSIVYSEKHDTQWIPAPVSKSLSKADKARIDSFFIPQLIDCPAEYHNAVEDYYTEVGYDDTLYNTKIGWVRLKETLYRNRVKIREITDSMNMIKETITQTVPKPKRVVGYLGAEAFGNKNSWVKGGAFSFGLQFKNDMYYEVKMYVIGSEGFVGGGFKMPIRGRKRK